MTERILVLDFGGQYNQLIARRIRECHVFCEVHPYTMPLEEIVKFQPKGIIFTGGPNSVYLEDAPTISKQIFNLGIPILGICYGSQLMAKLLGGKVERATVSEYGKTEITIHSKSRLFIGVNLSTSVWMSHTDYISSAPEDFVVTAHSKNCPVAAMEQEHLKLYAVQFHRGNAFGRRFE